MAINVVPCSSSSAFDYFVFPENSQSDQSYFQQQVSRFSNTLTDYGRQFMEASKNIYDAINDSEAIRLAKAALYFSREVLHPNQIRFLYSVEDIQMAEPVMQRYIMANPAIRQVYETGRINGYSDTYVDSEPGKSGLDQYDYRRVVDEMVLFNKDNNDEITWGVNTITEELYPTDRNLDFLEKAAIMAVWGMVEDNLETGMYDPTSPWGDRIK